VILRKINILTFHFQVINRMPLILQPLCVIKRGIFYFPVTNYISGLYEYLLQSLYYLDVDTSYYKHKNLGNAEINYV
jgi:hypothetical protein